MVYQDNEILSNNKEGMNHIFAKAWMTLENVKKWKKQVAKDHLFYASLYMRHNSEPRTFTKEHWIKNLLYLWGSSNCQTSGSQQEMLFLWENICQ